MADKTTIEWTDASWPVVTGCDHISEGCDNCYAAKLTSGRLKHLPAYAGLAENSRFNGQVRILEDRLDWPLKWRKGRKIFVSDMADLFHAKVPTDFITDVFAVMALTPQHTFQVLTKRHARLRSLLSDPAFWYQVGRKARHRGYSDRRAANHLGDGSNIYDVATWENRRHLPNAWIGVSVETQRWADIRIPVLLDTPAAVRWISAEPLLGPVDLTNVAGINAVEPDWMGGPTGGTGAPHPLLDWVVAGGESGPGARPMHPDWARSLRDQCQAARVPFLFKQWGAWTPTRFVGIGNQGPRFAYVGEPVDENGHRAVMERVGKKAAGRELDGRTWDEYPTTATAGAR